jgi:hypothetical protein
MNYIKKNILLIIIMSLLTLALSCSHTPKKHYPSNSIAILNANKKCMINFFDVTNFDYETKVIVTYSLDETATKEEKKIYEEIYRLMHIFLSNNNIQVVKLFNVDKEKIDNNLLKSNNIDKIINFSIDNIGVKYTKYTDFERGLISIQVNYNRIAYTSIFFQIIDVNTGIVEYSNFIDGTYTDIIPSKERDNLKSHNYIYYPQILNIYSSESETFDSPESDNKPYIFD